MFQLEPNWFSVNHTWFYLEQAPQRTFVEPIVVQELVWFCDKPPWFFIEVVGTLVLRVHIAELFNERHIEIIYGSHWGPP